MPFSIYFGFFTLWGLHNIFAFLGILEKFWVFFIDGACESELPHTHNIPPHTPSAWGSLFFRQRPRRQGGLLSFFLSSLTLPVQEWEGEGNYSHKHHYRNSCLDRFIGWNHCNYWDRSFRLSFASDSDATLFNTNVLLCVV